MFVCFGRTEILVEDFSKKCNAFTNLILNKNSSSEEDEVKHDLDSSSVHMPKAQTSGSNTCNQSSVCGSPQDEYNNSSSKKCVKKSCKPDRADESSGNGCAASLDLSEFELQMLEMQARQEENEEQSILAFEVCLSSAWSC